MQMELFQIYDRPAIYARDEIHETCFAWSRERGRFEEDGDALQALLGGSTEVRRIERDQARRLIARLLARSDSRTDAERAALDEFLAIEDRGARERVPLTVAERARRDAIAEAIVAGRIQSGLLGIDEAQAKLIA